MDVDKHLALIGALPLPDLNRLDGRDLARLSRAEQRQTRVATSFAIVAALFVGIADGVTPSSEAQASVVPFGPPIELTPLVQLARG